MATFAKIGLNSKVISVHSVHNNVLKDANGVEDENLGIEFLTNLHGWVIWKQTSYDGSIRKNFAGVGHTYDEDRDAFIPPCKFASWILNEDKGVYEAPVPFPDDGKNYTWDEENTQWIPKTDYSRRDGP